MLPGKQGRSLGELEGICASGINLETWMRLARVQIVFLGENIGGMWSDLSWLSHAHGEGGNSLAPTSMGRLALVLLSTCFAETDAEGGSQLFICLVSSCSGLDMRTMKICRVTCSSREAEGTREELPAHSSPSAFTHHVYSQFVPWWLGSFHPAFCSLLQILFLLQAIVVSIAREYWYNLYL